jgi:membrane fusion protein (multidrug efflux system)
VVADPMRTVPGAALTATLALSLLAGCAPQAADQTVEFRVPVSVEEVGTATIEDRIVTTGTVRTRELVTLNVLDTGLLEIAEGASGRLAEGDVVGAGDEIARIVGEDVRIAARLAAARQSYEAARSDLEANRSLLDQGLINQAVVDGKQSAFEDAKLEYERARRTEDRNRLITPIDGVILKIARDGDGQLLANGQLVTPGQTVAQVAPLDPLIADVDLVGEDIAAVRVGLEARVRYHAWEDRVFAGRVLRLAPTVDQKTRALRAEVEIDNHDRQLRPGMFVEVTLIGERRENVTVIPRRALTERGGRRVAFVLRGQRVARQDVTLGLGDDQLVEVRDGIVPGDRVVVRGLETLTDQMFVRVIE